MPASLASVSADILAAMGARRLLVIVCAVLIAAPLVVAVALHEDGPATVTASSGSSGKPPAKSSPNTTAAPRPSGALSASTLSFAAVGDIGSDDQGQSTLE